MPPPQTPERVERLLRQVVAWAAEQDEVQAVVLVGSYARGDARADSDVDLVLLVEDPRPFIEDHRWPARFAAVERLKTENWGEVCSVRVWHSGGPEIEFAVASPDWARRPLDEGTARVLQNGFRPLYDPRQLLPPTAPDSRTGPREGRRGRETEHTLMTTRQHNFPPAGKGRSAVYQPNPQSEFRVKFDFRVEFTNGGFVEGRDFLLDLEGTEVSDADLAEMIVEAMNLARAGRVRVRRKRIVRRGEHDDAPPAAGSC